MHLREYKSQSKLHPSLDGILACMIKVSRKLSEVDQRLDHQCAFLHVQDVWPTAVLDKGSLQSLLKKIEPSYKVPSATHIAQVVQCKHELGKRILKEKLTAEVTCLVVTTDI